MGNQNCTGMQALSPQRAEIWLVQFTVLLQPQLQESLATLPAAPVNQLRAADERQKQAELHSYGTQGLSHLQNFIVFQVAHV